MAFIVSLIIDEMIDDLTDALAVQGVAKATVIRDGPLHADPQAAVTSCMIYENDPSDLDGWLHEQIPGTFELDGSGLYKRRFTIVSQVFLTKAGLSRSDAKEELEMIHGRMIHALRDSTRITGLKDEYSEQTLLCVNGVEKSRCILRGGPQTSWIGDIKVWFTVITQM